MGPSQIPSLSVSGSFGSVPVSEGPSYVPSFVSLTSSSPSPSSSKSSINPVVDVPFIVSGNPSPSVSVSAEGSVGNASGPHSQSGKTGIAPSQTPSPSVSGFLGSVAGVDCNSVTSSIPSLSSSVSSMNSPSIG